MHRDPLGKPDVGGVRAGGVRVHFLGPKISETDAVVTVLREEFDLTMLAVENPIEAVNIRWAGRRIHH